MREAHRLLHRRTAQPCSQIYLGIAQMVARYLGVVEAVGSNPATQTNKSRLSACFFVFYSLGMRGLNPRSFCYTKRRHRRLTWGGWVARQKTSKRRFLPQRNRPKQGVEGRSRRPTRNDYATVEGRVHFLTDSCILQIIFKFHHYSPQSEFRFLLRIPQRYHQEWI